MARRNIFSRKPQRKLDITKRLQHYFGINVPQRIEVHYDGPGAFAYVGELEVAEVPIEKIEEETNQKIEVSIEKMQDPTQRRKNIGVRSEEDEEKAEERKEVPVPELVRIKNYNPEKIRFYRVFPKKDPFKVKYLATYDQDLVSEAPEFKFADTAQGSKYIGKFNMTLFGIIFGLIYFVTILALFSLLQPSYTPQNNNSLNLYIPLGISIMFLILIYLIHSRDIMRNYVKYILLQPAPMSISSSMVYPVILTNSRTHPLWEYFKRVAEVDDTKAREVFLSLQNWNEKQLNDVLISKEILKNNSLLADIEMEQLSLQMKERDILHPAGKRPVPWNYIVVTAVLVGIVTFILTATL